MNKYIATINVILLLIMKSYCTQRPNSMKIVSNGYVNVLISIHEDVPENKTVIQNIKETFTAASKFLYKATRKRVYFSSIDILVPNTWTAITGYQKTQSKSHYTADIRVKQAKSSVLNSPYVKSFSGCGQPGEYMVMTDEFLTNPDAVKKFGPRDKLLVHEWAHLRWGVFDEYETTKNNAFYYSKVTEKYEPTRCSRELVGSMYRITRTGKLVRCREVDLQGRYATSCRFFPKLKQKSHVETSIMDRQYINPINLFCDDSDKSGRQHNSEPKNKHNELCNSRSTWSVILSSPDFQNQANQPKNLKQEDLEPKFNIFRLTAKFTRVVMVLDQSGSMAGGKMIRMISAAKDFIMNYLSFRTEVGVVMFNSVGRVLVQLKTLNSHRDRIEVARSLPPFAGGMTSIGDGIRKALDLLHGKTGSGMLGGDIVLLSDGEENTSPMVSDVMNRVLTSEVTVHSIAYTQFADAVLSNISSQTGGFYDYHSNKNDKTKLKKALATIAQRLNPDISRVQIFIKSMNLPGKRTWMQKMYLTEGLGRSTLFELTYSNPQVVFNVSSPTGTVYNETSEHVAYSSLKPFYKYTLTVPNTAKAGLWEFSIQNRFEQTQELSVTFSTKPVNKTNPIVLRSYQSSPGNTWPPIWAIMAEASQDDSPVRGMTITAKIERPDGSIVDLQLLDNGQGADIRKDDGIYSRFFKKFNSIGRYSVTVQATALPGQAEVAFINAGQSAGILVDPDDENTVEEFFKLEKNSNSSKSIKSGIDLVASGGAIDFKPSKEREEILNNKDIYSPNTIRDLQVIATSFTVPSATLAWTAPGDDLDEGTAHEYEIFICSKDENFTSVMPIKQDAILFGNLTNPKSAGNYERFTVSVNYTYGTNVSYLFAVRAIDESGNMANLSNVVAAGFGTVLPRLEVNENYDDEVPLHLPSTLFNKITTKLHLSTEIMDTTSVGVQLNSGICIYTKYITVFTMLVLIKY